MNLQLKRPIVFFDLETTGINPAKDRVVEISMIKLSPGSDEPRIYHRLVNPEMPIPAEATAVHHITDKDVADKPRFKDIAHEIEQLLVGSDIAGFNSNRFDLPMLAQEFDRCGITHDFSRHRFVDVQTIFHKREPRNLVAAYRFYCDKELEGAHSSTADTMATWEVLEAQLERYPDLPRDIEQLSAYTTQSKNVDLSGRIVYNDQGVEVFNFGQYKGESVVKIFSKYRNYYDWIMAKDFPADTKAVCQRIFLRVSQQQNQR